MPETGAIPPALEPFPYRRQTDPPVLAEAPPPDRALMARSLAWLVGATAAIELVSLLVFDFPATDKVRIAALSAAAYGLVLLLAGASWRLPPWVFHVGLACTTLMVAGAIVFSGQSPSPYTFFFLWVGMYAAWFWGRAGAALHVGVVLAAYAGALLLTDQEFPPLANFLITAGTVVLAAVLIVGLKGRIDDLARRLASATRTDLLTGLLHRRAFMRTLEREIERAERTGEPLAVMLADIDRFRRFNERLGQDAGDGALERIAAHIVTAKRKIDVAGRIAGEEFAVILPATGSGGGSVLAERIRVAIAWSFATSAAPITVTTGIAEYRTHGNSAEALMQAAERAVYAGKALGRDRSVTASAEATTVLPTLSDELLATVLTLAEALDVRDTGTADHSQSVGHYAALMAQELGMPAAQVERIRVAGMLHDVGKIGVRDAVLLKPGPLTELEWSEIRCHPEIGARLLRHSQFDDISRWVRDHHERPDAMGYPRGASDGDVELAARILAVADAYEAMTADRPYRAALGHDVALEQLRRGAGTQFDAKVVEAFIAALEREETADRA